MSQRLKTLTGNKAASRKRRLRVSVQRLDRKLSLAALPTGERRRLVRRRKQVQAQLDSIECGSQADFI
jgi:hypothetical protein